jgi:hypothetical protein
MRHLLHSVGLCLVLSIKNVILHTKYVTCTLEHCIDIFQYFYLKYCRLLSSSTSTLVAVSQGNQIVRYLRPVTDVLQLTIRGARCAVVFCQGEFIPLFEIEYSDIFCVARIVHRFNSRIVID